MKLARQLSSVCCLSSLLVSLGSLLLTGCTTYVSAERVASRESYIERTASALSADDYSSATKLVLHRYNLEDQFQDSPVETLRSLHEKACNDDRRDLLFALAELNYLYA